MNQYFDENEYDTTPIKNDLEVSILNIAPQFSVFKNYLYQRVNVTTKDSWFAGPFSKKEYSYLEKVDIGSI